VVVNYDLLVGDISFYNQTLVFALLENERNGTDLLLLIENLMAPWQIYSNMLDEKNFINNQCIKHSEVYINAVMILYKICCYLFFSTIVIMIMSFPFNIYQIIKNILNSKNKFKSSYDDLDSS